MDTEQEDTSDGRPVVFKNQAASPEETASVGGSDGLGIALGQMGIQISGQRRVLIGSLATVEGQLPSLRIGEFPVLVSDPQEDLVRLGRVDDMVTDGDPDDGKLMSVSVMVGFEDVDSRRYSRLGVIQRHLLEVVEELRCHPVDDAVRDADYEDSALSVREGDGRLGSLPCPDASALPFEPLATQ